MTALDGVTKFLLDHRDVPLQHDDHAAIAALRAWRRVLFDLGGVGQAAHLYGGVGYGNLSVRGDGQTFVITGTQTQHHPDVTIAHLACVEEIDFGAHRVRSHGTTRPSSEAMTHAAIYAAKTAHRAVVHVHHPEVFARASALGIVAVDDDVDYGTFEMAKATLAIAASDATALVMRGHLDGVVTWGRSVEDAGLAMTRLISRAYALGRA